VATGIPGLPGLLWCAVFFNFGEKGKIMLLKEFLQQVDVTAPFSVQESYDNSGVQLGSPDLELRRGLVCLDVTPEVITEAIENDCNLVIAHHPLIFQGVKQITGRTDVEQVIIRAIKHDIAIVALHTNLDNVAQGVNHKLATVLGLSDLKILEPRKGLLKKLVTFCPTAQADQVRAAIFQAGAGHIGDYDCCSYNIEGKGSFRAGKDAKPFVGQLNELHFEPEVRIETIFPAFIERQLLAAMFESHPYEEVAYDIYPLDNAFDKVGSGMTGSLEQPLSEKDFLQLVKEKLNIPVVRHSPFTGKEISKVAVCGGSGSFLLHKAVAAGVQAFVTGDVKYHQFFDPFPNALLVDAGHFETEQFTKELMYEIVNKKFSKFALLISKVHTNPVNYF
jgi:dinuclear metal center YbgI/SA1388 family protein